MIHYLYNYSFIISRYHLLSFKLMRPFLVLLLCCLLVGSLSDPVAGQSGTLWPLPKGYN